jgi:starch synthase
MNIALPWHRRGCGGARLDPFPTETRLRVGIATSGRSHLLDVARELDALGTDVRFYSYVSGKRAETFGLPGRCHVPLLPFLFPLVALERLFPRLLPRTVERLMCWGLDMLAILRMRRCDAFICMSGVYLHAPRFAKWRYGAKICLHRGSEHILAQDRILSRLPQARRPTQFIVRRELRGYELADVIVIPSNHVAESFAAWPSLASKLLQSTYGVDLNQFPLRGDSLLAEPTVLYVGQWSYRKGSDILARAIQAMDSVHLVHVGSLVDAPFPDDPRFIHHGPVPQWKLKDFYQSAHVFALPSREDGFGLVLPQALASGLRIVCTDRTGGPDLGRLPSIARLIRVVPAENVDALHRALTEALSDATGKTDVPSITDAERQVLSWRTHALRHLQTIREMLQPIS